MTGKLIQTYIQKIENKNLNCISNVEVKHLLMHFIPILFASAQSLICNESVWFRSGCQCWFNGRWWWCLILLTMMMKIAIFDVGATAMLFYEGSERELWCRDGTQRRNFLSFWSTAHMAQWWWGGGGLREGRKWSQFQPKGRLQINWLKMKLETAIQNQSWPLHSRAHLNT